MMEIEKLYLLFQKSSGVSTDTRTLKSGELFFALQGPNFDGSAFIETALEKGALAVVTQNLCEGADESRIILVNNVLSTLQKLATHHRKALKISVLAITGSNGKTTTKELIREVLATRYSVFATPGNLNNHIGVPLSLLKMKAEHEIAVIELGANHPGEIWFLAEMALPDYGLITNCGKDHLEGFGTVEGSIKANAELFDALDNSGGLAFVNVEQNYLEPYIPIGLRKVTFGNGTAFLGKVVEMNPFVRLELSLEKIILSVQTRLVGAYNLENVLAAAVIGSYFSVPSELIEKALESYVPSNNRSQLSKWKQHSVILDAYNANPSSVLPALENFEKLNGPHKIVILGDMLELGAWSKSEHREVLNRLKMLKADLKIVVGSCFIQALEGQNFTDILSFNNTEELKLWWAEQALPPSLILLKGSRGIALEKLVQDSFN